MENYQSNVRLDKKQEELIKDNCLNFLNSFKFSEIVNSSKGGCKSFRMNMNIMVDTIVSDSIFARFVNRVKSKILPNILLEKLNNILLDTLDKNTFEEFTKNKYSETSCLYFGDIEKFISSNNEFLEYGNGILSSENGNDIFKYLGSVISNGVKLYSLDMEDNNLEDILVLFDVSILNYSIENFKISLNVYENISVKNFVAPIIDFDIIEEDNNEFQKRIKIIKLK